MTLSSLVEVRPPAAAGVAETLVWTTVSTRSRTITLAITGFRMSARTKSARARSPGRQDVDTDDALDIRRPGQLRRETTPEIAGNTGD